VGGAHTFAYDLRTYREAKAALLPAMPFQGRDKPFCLHVYQWHGSYQSGYEPEGQVFESPRAHHSNQPHSSSITQAIMGDVQMPLSRP